MAVQDRAGAPVITIEGHTHVWVHVATRDWRRRPIIRAQCACGDKLTPDQITNLRKQMGLPA